MSLFHPPVLVGTIAKTFGENNVEGTGKECSKMEKCELLAAVSRNFVEGL